MSVHRGAVVIVDWPFASGQGRKPRPALVVQNDRDNQRLQNTILAMITSMTRRASALLTAGQAPLTLHAEGGPGPMGSGAIRSIAKHNVQGLG
jgi:mRNA-degrading endonuclease toxin of MazEF toxin-antitoxin module